MRKRRARRRTVGARAAILVEARANARRSLDFVHDQFACGRRFRILNIVGDVTREFLAAIPDTSISGRRVARELPVLIQRRGKPGRIVSDNGTEFTSNAMLGWARENEIDWRLRNPDQLRRSHVAPPAPHGVKSAERWGLAKLFQAGGSARQVRFLAALVCLAFSALASCGQQVAKPTYFRVTAHLKHGDEPIDFDVVVECRWSVAGELGGAPSGRASRSPYLYGVKTKDNHAVLMQIPGACWTDPRIPQYGRVPLPARPLPIFFWSDMSDDFPMLVGYFSEDGYRHPLSQLTFIDAAITTATQPEREEWLRTSAPNLVTRQNDPFQRWPVND